MRKAILNRDAGLCQVCVAAGHATVATEVDHIVPKAEGGTDEETNLQSICRCCHAVKTKEEARRGIRRGWGAEGT